LEDFEILKVNDGKLDSWQKKISLNATSTLKHEWKTYFEMEAT